VTRVDRPLRVAVVGAARASRADYGVARVLGGALARAGAIIVCGGHGGVMEAAALGATEAGGITVGILPGDDAEAANPWIVIPIATGMGDARNALVVAAAEAVLAVGGAWGTLSEIALAKKMGLEVGVLGSPPAEGMGLQAFEEPEAAAEWALARALERRKGDE